MIPPKGVYLPISKLHSISAVANLFAHNNVSEISYCGQISLQSAAVSCSFSDNLTPLGVTFFLLILIYTQGKCKEMHRDAFGAFGCHLHCPKWILLVRSKQ